MRNVALNSLEGCKKTAAALLRCQRSHKFMPSLVTISYYVSILRHEIPDTPVLWSKVYRWYPGYIYVSLSNLPNCRVTVLKK